MYCHAGGPAAETGSAEAIVEDMVRTDEEQWDERLSQQDVQQVTGLPASIVAAACPLAFPCPWPEIHASYLPASGFLL